MNENFVSTLKTELEDCHVECCECNKSLSVVHGEQIKTHATHAKGDQVVATKFRRSINCVAHYQFT